MKNQVGALGSLETDPANGHIIGDPEARDPGPASAPPTGSPRS